MNASSETEKLLMSVFRYHKLIKTFTKFYHKYKDLVLIFGSTCYHFMKHGISHPTFYGNVENIAKKFKQNPHCLKIHLNNLSVKDVGTELLLSL